MAQDPQNVVWLPGGEGKPPAELSDAQIEEIHSGMLHPSAEAIHSMAREIRKWRGTTDPDSV